MVYIQLCIMVLYFTPWLNTQTILNKMIYFGADSAATNMGKKNGAAVQLESSMLNKLTRCPCHAHRLETALKKVRERSTVVNTTVDMVKTLIIRYKRCKNRGLLQQIMEEV